MSKKLTTEQFVVKAIKVHNNQYDYTNVTYVAYNSRIEIVCKQHGMFKQFPTAHLSGHGCQKCATENRKLHNTYFTKTFIIKAQLAHNNRYSYENAQYIKAHSALNITCNIHGEFTQKAYHHLNGHGCPKCADQKCGDRTRIGIEKFLERAKIIHNDKYRYSNLNFTTLNEYIDILCPIHGTFKQKATDHIHGKQGCPQCANINKGGWKIKPADVNTLATLYMVRLLNHAEEFIKIGITKLTIATRMRSICLHKQYKYEVLASVQDKLVNIFEKEQELKRIFKTNRYIPILKFGGSSECFSENISSFLLDHFHKYNNKLNFGDKR